MQTLEKTGVHRQRNDPADCAADSDHEQEAVRRLVNAPGDVSRQQVEGTMSDVDDLHDAETQSESAGQDEQEAAVRDPAQDLGGPLFHDEVSPACSVYLDQEPLESGSWSHIGLEATLFRRVLPIEQRVGQKCSFVEGPELVHLRNRLHETVGDGAAIVDQLHDVEVAHLPVVSVDGDR